MSTAIKPYHIPQKVCMSVRIALIVVGLIGVIIPGFLGISGFVLGEPDYPRVGNLEADQNLLRILPGAFELGSVDHIVHMLISALLIYTAYTFSYIKKK